MKNNVVYARTCLKGSNLNEQIEIINQYVKDNNIEISNYNIDDGYTGHDKKKPGFNNLLKDVSSNKIGMVIISTYERLARDYLMLEKCLDLFEKYNVELKVIYGEK